MAELEIFSLHGFLGRPEEVQQGEAIDYFRIPELSPEVTLADWGRAFNLFIKKRSRLKVCSTRRKLRGYSLGGRLALHAFQEDPEFWSEVELLSTHPGFGSETEREARLRQDEIWARRFDRRDDNLEDWESLMRDWNSQPVFAGSAEKTRREEDYDRSQLALALRHWSLGCQRDFRGFLSAHRSQWQVYTGSLDLKFT
ncbi:MAG: hypothetical protein WCH11_02055, partial [Bdellovibrio sp.]